MQLPYNTQLCLKKKKIQKKPQYPHRKTTNHHHHQTHISQKAIWYFSSPSRASNNFSRSFVHFQTKECASKILLFVSVLGLYCDSGYVCSVSESWYHGINLRLMTLYKRTVRTNKQVHDKIPLFILTYLPQAYKQSSRFNG